MHLHEYVEKIKNKGINFWVTIIKFCSFHLTWFSISKNCWKHIRKTIEQKIGRYQKRRQLKKRKRHFTLMMAVSEKVFSFSGRIKNDKIRSKGHIERHKVSDVLLLSSISWIKLLPKKDTKSSFLVFSFRLKTNEGKPSVEFLRWKCLMVSNNTMMWRREKQIIITSWR